MLFSQKQPMLPHVRGEHIESIRDKLDDLSCYSPYGNVADWAYHADRVLKAVSVYIIKEGNCDQE